MPKRLSPRMATSVIAFTLLVTLIEGCTQPTPTPAPLSTPTLTPNTTPKLTSTPIPATSPSVAVTPTIQPTLPPAAAPSSVQAVPEALRAILSRPIEVTKIASPILQIEDIPWATHYPEHPQIIKVGSTYHMYFHASQNDSYRIGHASAPSPLGPWTADAKPIIDIGAEGSWTALYAATPYVMRVGDTYYMWYSGHSGSAIRTGLATASTPEGPWTPDPGNPFTGPEQWVGSVVYADSQYYLLGGGELQQVVWTAPSPAGPWTGPIYWYGPERWGGSVAYVNSKYYVLGGGELLQTVWTAPSPASPWIGLIYWHAPESSVLWRVMGSMGESALTIVDGVWYMFFSGVDTLPLNYENKRPFNIGLALSDDGTNWYEYPKNPIIRHGGPGDYDEFRLSEIGVYYESGIFYVTYTAIGQKEGWAVWSVLAMATVIFK